MTTTDRSPAEVTFDELSERLAEPEKPQIKYLKMAPPVNRAMKRASAKAVRLRAKHFETWKRQLNAAQINWEDVLVERAKKLKERLQIDVRTVGEAEGDTTPDSPAA